MQLLMTPVQLRCGRDFIRARDRGSMREDQLPGPCQFGDRPPNWAESENVWSASLFTFTAHLTLTMRRRSSVSIAVFALNLLLLDCGCGSEEAEHTGMGQQLFSMGLDENGDGKMTRKELKRCEWHVGPWTR